MLKRLLLVLIFTAPAFLFLLQSNYYNMHDDMQPIRQLEMEKCLKDGQIPCRWTPDLGNGYGYPLFNYYPPLPYIVGQIFRSAGLSFLTTIKLTTTLQIIAAALAMYLLASSLSTPLSGLLASVLYTYSPYHAVNIYIRGAMNEAWASVFFPLIFYFIKKVIEKGRTIDIILLSLSLCAILLSHNPMVMIFCPFAILWALIWIIITRINIIKSLLRLTISIIIGLSLSAFYTIPALLETKLVHIDTMFNNYYSYFAHFTTIKQLFISSFWGDGPSVWGQYDGMPFFVGYLHWIIPILVLILAIIRYLSHKKRDTVLYLAIFFLISLFFTAFLTHERSIMFWKILSPIQKIQFPWRFLSLTMFFSALSSIFLPLLVNKIKIKFNLNILIILITLLTIYINYPYFKPLKSGPITDKQKFEGSWINMTTGSIYDYLPITARLASTKPASGIIDNISPAYSTEISNIKQGTDWLKFTSISKSESTLTLTKLYFPNFILTVDGQPHQIKIEPEFGRIFFTLTPGPHQISLKLHNTAIRTLSNYVSFIAWIIVLFYLISLLWPMSQKFRQ